MSHILETVAGPRGKFTVQIFKPEQKSPVLQRALVVTTERNVNLTLQILIGEFHKNEWDQLRVEVWHPETAASRRLPVEDEPCNSKT